MPRVFVSLFGSGGDVLPVAAGGGGVAPTVTQTELTLFDNGDSGNAKMGTAISSWSAAVGDVVVGIWTWRNSNNTDNLAAAVASQFDGTAVLGTFTIHENFVFHDGSRSTMIVMASAVCTTLGTVQLDLSGTGGFAAGIAERNNAILLVHGADSSAGRINATNHASHVATPALTGNVATGGAGILIAVAATETAVTITDPVGWTPVIKDSNCSIIYKATTTNITDQGSWALSGASNGAAAIIAIKSATP